MSLAVRVIPCLDVDAGRVVKGVNFENLRDAGDPVELARAYDLAGADELTFLDVTASSGDRETTYDVVRRTAEQVFIPLTVGGGVRSTEDVDRLLRAGADKVGVNTAAIARPELITEIAADPMRPEEALGLVGLGDRMDHFPAELSGGQQQRVAVARAIAKRPEVLFCDEPTGSLDSASGIQVLEAIVKVAAETGATVMMVTHNAAIGDIADRVIRFRDGKVAEITVNPSRKAPSEVAW